MFCRYRRRKGFTLVEILLALVILGVGLVSILSLFAVATHSARRVLNLTKTSLLAQLTFEELKLLSITDYNNGLLSDGTHDENAINAVSVRPSEYTNPDFNRSLAVKQNPLGTGTNEVKELELTVSWDSSSEVFVTYVAKYSP